MHITAPLQTVEPKRDPACIGAGKMMMGACYGLFGEGSRWGGQGKVWRWNGVDLGESSACQNLIPIFFWPNAPPFSPQTCPSKPTGAV